MSSSAKVETCEHEVRCVKCHTDRLGIFLSGTCAIHCMLSSVFLFLSPSLTVFSENEWVHVVLLAVILPVAALALYRGWQVHKILSPLLIAGCGVFFLIGGLLLRNSSVLDVPPLTAEFCFTLIGSGLLIFAHFKNIRLAQ